MTANNTRSPSCARLLVALAAALIGCATAEQNWTSGPLRSPGGRWIAEVHDETHGWNTFPRTVVDVRLANDTLATVVLEPWGDWSGGENLRLRWSSADVLEISVPNRTLFDRRLRSFQGLAIQVVYQNENPADREFWRRRQAGALSLRQPEGQIASPPVERTRAAQQRDEADER